MLPFLVLHNYNPRFAMLYPERHLKSSVLSTVDVLPSVGRTVGGIRVGNQH